MLKSSVRACVYRCVSARMCMDMCVCVAAWGSVGGGRERSRLFSQTLDNHSQRLQNHSISTHSISPPISVSLNIYPYPAPNLPFCFDHTVNSYSCQILAGYTFQTLLGSGGTYRAILYLEDIKFRKGYVISKATVSVSEGDKKKERTYFFRVRFCQINRHSTQFVSL